MKHILLVDDNIVSHDPGGFGSAAESEKAFERGAQLGLMGYFIREMREIGLSVSTATTVEDAEKKCEANNYDLIIIDIMLPYLDRQPYDELSTAGGLRTGFVLAEKIRKRHPETPIWILSQIVPSDSSLVNTATIRDLTDRGIVNAVVPKLGCDPSKFAQEVMDFLGE